MSWGEARLRAAGREISPAHAEMIQGPVTRPPTAGGAAAVGGSIVPMSVHALPHTSMTQRKPMWVVDVSTDWGERAGGR